MAGLVVIGQKKSPIVEKISTTLNAPFIEFHLDWFADTEPSLIIGHQEKLTNKTAIMVFQIDLMFENDRALHSINDHMAGLLHLISAIKNAGAQSIIAVLPYLPYARQEKDVTAKHQGPLTMWAAVLKVAGIDHIITCDIHSPEGATCLGTMLYEISAAHFWAENIKKIVPHGLDISNNLCVVSPDNGGLNRARIIAKELGCSHAFIDKTRIAKDNTVATELNGNVHGKIAIIVDDILGTAKTASNACELLLNHGAQSVIGCFTHAIFSPGATQRLAAAGFEKVLITDTLTSAIKQENATQKLFSIDDYLAESVCKIVKNL